MRVICRHGHIAFLPRNARDIARFSSFFDQELERSGDFYTFPALKDLPRYSITGSLFGNLPAIETFEGQNSWDVMRENGFVYSIMLGILVPKQSIVTLINPPLVGYYFLAQSPLIQPGSRNLKGEQILSYDAEYDFNTSTLKVLEFQYD